jgi:predicted O-methyltransferase YrrM
LLKEVADFTRAHHPEHNMLSGHLQGKFLEMASCMLQPQRILEIGTFTGYSALCLAKGLSEDGRLHTIELREEDAKTAKNFFNQSAYAGKIILHTGNALSIIPQLTETWDLVFIDADKPAYTEYFNLVLPKVRKNGFIFADNIFFHGEALQADVKGKNAKAIRSFTELVSAGANTENLILTLRDGLYIIRKL